LLLSIFNPKIKGIYLIRAKVTSPNLQIIDTNNKSLEGNIICQIPNNCELYFKTNLEAYSLHFFKLLPSNKSLELSPKNVRIRSPSSSVMAISIKINENSFIKINNIEKQKFTYLECEDIKERKTCTENSFVISYNFYQSGLSGLYIFAPQSNEKSKY
jgi:hypothetical protein